MTAEQERALRSLNVSTEAFEALERGKMIAVDLDTHGGEQGIAAIQITAEVLRCGIIAISDPGGGLPTFLQFRRKAFHLAKAFGHAEVMFFGASIINARLKELLVRHGFRVAHLEVPANLGGGIMEVCERVYPIPERLGGRDA